MNEINNSLYTTDEYFSSVRKALKMVGANIEMTSTNTARIMDNEKQIGFVEYDDIDTTGNRIDIYEMVINNPVRQVEIDDALKNI